MATKILTEDQPLVIETIVVTIFGVPGVGKSSLSFTTDSPVNLDFDEGVKRAVKRKTAASFDTWQDAWYFIHSKDFADLNCKTLIVDTGGVMLDNYIARHVVTVDDKNGKKGGGVSLQGYGAMKEVFYTFLNDVKKRGMDVVFICHANSEKEGDVSRHFPKMTGGSYDILMAASDLVGYMETINNKRSINFNPTDRNVGKNSAQFPVITVPDYMAPGFDNFLGNLIQQAKEKMMELSEAQKASIEKIEALKVEVTAAKSLTELEQILTAAGEMTPVIKTQVNKLVEDKYVELFTLEIIEPVSTPDEANAVLKQINDGKKYLHSLQTELKKKTDTLKFVFDKEAKTFTKPAAGGKDESKKKVPATNGAQGDLLKESAQV